MIKIVVERRPKPYKLVDAAKRETEKLVKRGTMLDRLRKRMARDLRELAETVEVERRRLNNDE
jgi:hypothetical protein